MNKDNFTTRYLQSLVLRCSGSGDDLHQFAGDDGLAGPVEEDLEFVNHVACVLGRVLFVGGRGTHRLAVFITFLEMLLGITHVHGVAAG